MTEGFSLYQCGKSFLRSAELQLSPRIPFHVHEVVIFLFKKSPLKASAGPAEVAALADMQIMQRSVWAFVSGKG